MATLQMAGPPLRTSRNMSQAFETLVVTASSDLNRTHPIQDLGMRLSCLDDNAGSAS